MGRLAFASVSTWVTPPRSALSVAVEGGLPDRSDVYLARDWSESLPAGHDGIHPVPGRRIGRYSLIERLGRGRQAEVWRAIQTEPPCWEVALKVIPGAGRDPKKHARLRREAERAARLDGPGLLTAYEFGEDRGVAFMAMPLVVGTTLAAVIDRRRAIRSATSTVGAHPLALMSEPAYTRATVRVMTRVARALAQVHAARVAHRDIKPGNILIGRHSDQAGCVYLCDFGLARDLDVATPHQLRDGAGTPLYMSPERLLRFQADELRADVYALGATLFEALTLETPVEVSDDMPHDQWATHLATSRPRRASELRDDLPPALDELVAKALARDPGLRQPTAGHFAAELERCLSA